MSKLKYSDLRLLKQQCKYIDSRLSTYFKKAAQNWSIFLANAQCFMFNKIKNSVKHAKLKPEV